LRRSACREAQIGDDPVMGGGCREPIHAGLEDLVGQALDLGPIEPGRAVVPTVPLPIPRLSATARWLCPRHHFCRRISRIWRMDSRSVAIAPFLGEVAPSDVQRR